MPVFSGPPKVSAWRDDTAWAGRRVNSAWKVPTTSHLQKETQRPGLRHCQVFFAEPPSQTFYETGITPKPEKSLGPSYIFKGMSNKPRHSLKDCPQSKEPACSLLLLARVLPDGRIPSCHEHKEQETRPLHLSCFWCCHWALQTGDRSMPSLLPDFVTVVWLSQAYCLFNVNYVWGLFVFRSLEAFGQGPPVDESLLLVFVISSNTCKHYVVSAHLSLQGKETWLFLPRASAIWFGTYSAQKVQRLHVFY